MNYLSGTIRLDGLKFYARHGVMPQETKVGAWFTVDLRLRTNLEEAVSSDELEDTLNYAGIYDHVKRVMDEPSRLVEAAAGRIAKTLFDSYPQVEALTVRLMKDNPPVGCECAGFGVELNYER